MIAEKFPQIAQLSREDRLTLVEELVESLENEPASPEFDSAVSALLEKRQKHYEQHPETAITWEALKANLPPC